jgi:hypothetical protein
MLASSTWRPAPCSRRTLATLDQWRHGIANRPVPSLGCGTRQARTITAPTIKAEKTSSAEMMYSSSCGLEDRIGPVWAGNRVIVGLWT